MKKKTTKGAQAPHTAITTTSAAAKRQRVPVQSKVPSNKKKQGADVKQQEDAKLSPAKRLRQRNAPRQQAPTAPSAKKASVRSARAAASVPFQDQHAAREAERYAEPIASREAILDLLDACDGPQTAEEIADRFGVTDRIEILGRRLGAMVRDGQLVQNRRGGFAPVQHTNLIAGTVIANPDGFGFLKPDEEGRSVFTSLRDAQGDAR